MKSMFHDLNNNELKQIFTLSPVSEKVKSMISQELDVDSRFALQDHAYGEYWNRKIETLTYIDDSQIQSIVNHINFPTAKGILGESAVRGLIDKNQCEQLLKVIPEGEWAFRAIKARLILFKVIETSTVKSSEILNGLNELIELKMTWAILEILPYLDQENVLKLKAKMEDKSLLNKGNRHIVREEIHKIDKKRKKAAEP